MTKSSVADGFHPPLRQIRADPSNNCAGNHIQGGLTTVNNTGGGGVIGNQIGGSWLITNNTPPFAQSGNHH